MKKIKKQYLYSVLLIIAFAFFSTINVHLILKKGNNDMILLFSIACFFFVLWLCDVIFSDRLFGYIYKIFQKPMTKSRTMDFMGTNIVSEKKAYETFHTMIEFAPYIYVTILIIGIVLLVLVQ